MNKSILLIMAILLTACASTPQVTVTPEATVTSTPPPTETLIPTPTFHPQFTALQNEIVDSSMRFTLQANGLIYDGETPIPGITVAQDGTLTISVNDETVTIDPADVTFDDEAGISIDGYELDENGEWVAMIIPENTEMGIEILGIMQELGVDVGENGTVKLQMDGESVVCIENATAEIVCRDGAVSLDFLQEALSGAGDLVGGPSQTPNPRSSRPNQPPGGSRIATYSVELARQFRTEYKAKFGIDPWGGTGNGRIEFILIGEDRWAVAAGSMKDGVAVFENLAFRPRSDETTIKWFKIMPANGVDWIWDDEASQ